MDLATILSILALGGAGALVPLGLMRMMPDSQKGLVLALIASIVILKALGAALFAWTYGREIGVDAASGLVAHFWNLGGRASLIWGPILALTAYVLATGIERRKGERMAARE